MTASTASLADRLQSAPVLARPDLAQVRFASLRAWLVGDPSLLALVERPPVEALLLAIADHSPYLWRLVVADPPRLAGLLARSPEASLAAALDTMAAACARPGETQDEAMQALRAGKATVALLVALADLGGAVTVDEVVAMLTAFADCAVQCALEFLLRQAHAAGRLSLPDPDHPSTDCGLVVLALGKQGGRELNYSSDIDIVVFFDPHSAAIPPGASPAPVYVKLTQALARMLSERTSDGYVLRVDLRLRPDPASTAIAISLPSAFAYYETYGQNWERAALIKARPVAGDLPLGDAFLKDLAPFIWRKYFDYAAIADIHAMKRQIHAVRGHTAIAVAGHDVKLGRGGIREIEFFVQTQQLIFGGRRPHLRGSRTLAMLEALHRDGWVDPSAVTDLSAAYRFLRTIEHRLQMIADEQTQRLPADPDALEQFARFAGFADSAAFATAFTHHARSVEIHYARLFEHAPALDAEAGSLVFTGVEDDPATIETLKTLGFARPADVAELVRGWHFGRRAAVQTPRAREILTDLVPRLLKTFARSSDPDGALVAFDAMLARLRGATELMAMLRSNDALLDLFGDILGLAPRLAATVAARPHVLDAAIDPASLASAADPVKLEARLAATLTPALPAEEFLDRARDIAQEEMFLIGVRLLSGADLPRRAGEAYADLAAMIVRSTLAHVRHHFEGAHGRVPGGACVVVAMGRLGSREMTAGSDLDLLLVYEGEPASESDGVRPLDAVRYYTRLTQRLIAALGVATRRGRLYDVDMRLRPSGGQGPLATRLASFIGYQAEEAATWEHMALTRARVIAGDEALAARVRSAIDAVLARRRDAAVIRRDVAGMRALVAQQKGDADIWDFKQAAGGLSDIEFMAQTLVLCHAADHPDLADPSTAAVLMAAGRLGLVPEAMAARLNAAQALLTALLQVTRLSTVARFDPAAAGPGLRRRLAQAADLPDFERIEPELRRMLAAVRRDFVALVGKPAIWEDVGRARPAPTPAGLH